MPRARPTKWVVWIIVGLWRLVCRFVDAAGRLPAFVVGAILVVLGLMLSVSIIGAVVGVPMVIVGGALIACALLRRKRRRRWPRR